MIRVLGSRPAHSLVAALVGAGVMTSTAVATHGGTHVVLQSDAKGCTGVLPSTDGNADMRLVGGTLTPGGTAIFEITYPLEPTTAKIIWRAKASLLGTNAPDVAGVTAGGGVALTDGGRVFAAVLGARMM